MARNFLCFAELNSFDAIYICELPKQYLYIGIALHGPQLIAIYLYDICVLFETAKISGLQNVFGLQSMI